MMAVRLYFAMILDCKVRGILGLPSGLDRCRLPPVFLRTPDSGPQFCLERMGDGKVSGSFVLLLDWKFSSESKSLENEGNQEKQVITDQICCLTGIFW